MSYAIFGAGLMGSAIARDLVKSKNVDKVAVFDIDRNRLSALRRIERSPKLSVSVHDVRRRQRTVELLRKFDVGIGALPHGLSDYAVESAARAGVNFVDLIFGWRFSAGAIDKAARKRNVTILPACGVAPGLTNILAMDAADQMDRVREVHIKVGGIPAKPKPPLNYRVVFSLEAVLEEYLRKAKIIHNGRPTEVPALSGLETVTFPPPIGKVESFYTDGLSTLIKTLRPVREMDEKTLRWPGHVAQILTLKECGLLDTEGLRYKGHEISPRQFLANLLSDKLALRDGRDVTLFRVDVTGTSRGHGTHVRYEMVDHYDTKLKMTSMARTTGYPASVAAQMLAEGKVQSKGLTPPELAIRKSNLKEFMRRLAAKGIRIKQIRRQT